MEKKKTYILPRTTWVWVGLDKRVAEDYSGSVNMVSGAGPDLWEGNVKGEANAFDEPLPQLKSIWDEAW